MLISIAFIVGALGANPIQQGPEKPKVIEIIPKHIYTPRGFDSNDVVQIILEGDFPNNCYRIAKIKADADEEKIVFRATAYQYPGACTQSITPYLRHADVDILEEGTYPVWNATKKDGPMGNVSVRHTDSPKRDDFDYANVDSSVVYYDANLQRSVLMLFGKHSESCFRFDREKFVMRQTAKDVLEILPILRREEDVECKSGEFSFREKFVIPENIRDGRYLFYIRIADGQSFYKTDFVTSQTETDR